MRVSKFYLEHAEGSPRRSRRHEPEADAALGDDQEGLLGHLQLAAARPHHAAQDRADRARGDEPRRARSSATCRTSSPPSCGRRPAAGTSSGRSSSRSATGTSATSCSDRRTRSRSPTSIRKDVRSYRQLPVNLYQIQVKFRDEIRPRFGVMRGREFLMKDAYSFDVDRDALMRSYRAMYDAYARIFTRLGLKFRAVEADTGAIGGFASHEFQVLADAGEDAIAWCPQSEYAANVEQAEALAPAAPRPAPAEAMRKVATPTQTHLRGRDRAPRAAARAQRQVPAGVRRRTACTMLLVRGDHMGNEVKIGKLPGLAGWRWASDAEIVAATGLSTGFLGPVGLRADVPLIVDRTVGGDGGLRLRRQRGGLPPGRRQLRARLPRAGPGRRPPQRRRRRSLARRQGAARDPPRDRGRARVRARAPATRRTWARPTSTPRGSPT